MLLFAKYRSRANAGDICTPLCFQQNCTLGGIKHLYLYLCICIHMSLCICVFTPHTVFLTELHLGWNQTQSNKSLTTRGGEGKLSSMYIYQQHRQCVSINISIPTTRTMVYLQCVNLKFRLMLSMTSITETYVISICNISCSTSYSVNCLCNI